MNTNSCIFCGIVDGTNPASTIYRDDMVIAVASPEPRARVHVLLIASRHVSSVDALSAGDQELWIHVLQVAQKIARAEGIDVDAEGYQLVTNAGRHAARQFPHLHIHLLNGAPCDI